MKYWCRTPSPGLAWWCGPDLHLSGPERPGVDTFVPQVIVDMDSPEVAVQMPKVGPFKNRKAPTVGLGWTLAKISEARGHDLRWHGLRPAQEWI